MENIPFLQTLFNFYHSNIVFKEQYMLVSFHFLIVQNGFRILIGDKADMGKL